jgi:hypothetical protein
MLMTRSEMRLGNGEVEGWGPKSADGGRAVPLRTFCEKFKGMGLSRKQSTLELGRNHIKAKLGEFVESD